MTRFSHPHQPLGPLQRGLSHCRKSPIPGSFPIKAAAQPQPQSPPASPPQSPFPRRALANHSLDIAPIPLPPIPLPIPAPERPVSLPNSTSPRDPERSHSRNHSCPFAKFVVPPFAHFHASNLPHKSPAHHSHTPFPKSAKPSVFIHAPAPPVHRSSPAPAPTSTFHPRPKTRRPQLRPPPRHSANRILASTFSSRVPFPRNVPDTGRISP